MWTQQGSPAVLRLTSALSGSQGVLLTLGTIAWHWLTRGGHQTFPAPAGSLVPLRLAGRRAGVFSGHEHPCVGRPACGSKLTVSATWFDANAPAGSGSHLRAVLIVLVIICHLMRALPSCSGTFRSSVNLSSSHSFYAALQTHTPTCLCVSQRGQQPGSPRRVPLAHGHRSSQMSHPCRCPAPWERSIR